MINGKDPFHGSRVAAGIQLEDSKIRAWFSRFFRETAASKGL